MDPLLKIKRVAKSRCQKMITAWEVSGSESESGARYASGSWSSSRSQDSSVSELLHRSWCLCRHGSRRASLSGYAAKSIGGLLINY